MTALRDLMNARVVSAPPEKSVAATAEAMVAANVGSAVIMQGSFLAGIITERDVLRAAASGQDLTACPVSEWMTPDPHAASPDTSVDEAARIMFLNGFRHLPIAEDGRVCGVVSLRELFAARIRRPRVAEPRLPAG